MPSSQSNINHNALKHLIEAGSINSAKAIANGDIWTLVIAAGEQEKVVMAKNSGQARIWRKLDTLTKYLKNLGLDHFTIDATHYNPLQKSLKRPDSSVALKRTHQAHKSLQAKIPKSPEKTKLTEKVKEKWEERRAKILQQEDPRAK